METKIEEIWKEVPNSSRYKVSSTGRVWDNEKSIIVIQKVHSGGYLHVKINVPPQIKYCIAVHRLVLWAFHGILTNRSVQCNHKDGNKQNNNLSNLESVTPSENLLHAYRTGLHPGAWHKYKKKFGLWSERQKKQKP